MEKEIIAGRKPVLEGLEQHVSIDRIYIDKGVKGDYEKSIRQLCREREIPLKTVPKQFFRKYGRLNHQGILALKASTIYYKLDDLLPALNEREKPPLVLLLEGVTDVRNLGAIARSAEVFGVDILVVPMKNSAPVNVEAYKTSAGAIQFLPIAREKSITSAIKRLKEYGFIIYGTELHGEKSPAEIQGDDRIALVMGSEDKGLGSETLKLLDEKIRIPQVGKSDSLNVSVACGICLYEILKERKFEK
ncbi:MAG TPA: 23S rRNA (guanosine(2251)-2'-O)-methyltransferase RlmB [Saprospiraceae bacterium]|nr:23S rRNA (guanosine(2251)-2'-O)-methyltransferase RlmB [Saprospiraceae bacterium]